MSRACCTASSKIPRARSTSPSSFSSSVHLIQACPSDGSYYRSRTDGSRQDLQREHYVETTDLKELLVERPTSIKLSQMKLHLDVLDEKFGFGTHADSGTEDLACSSDVESPNFEGGVSSPELVRRLLESASP